MQLIIEVATSVQKLGQTQGTNQFHEDCYFRSLHVGAIMKRWLDQQFCMSRAISQEFYTDSNFRNDPWEQWAQSQNWKQLKYQVFLTRVASFSQFGPISDPHIKFQKSQNRLNDLKEQENINYMILKPIKNISGH